MAIRQAFAWWAFTYGRDVEADALLGAAADIGYDGVEMLPVELWPLARAHGLELVTHSPLDLEIGFNDPDHHVARRDEAYEAIDEANEGGVRAVIVFAGSRGRLNDADAIGATAEGLAPVAAHAESAGVLLLLELLNSKVDHPGHQCDHTQWGAAVVDAVGSSSLQLLYDAYHMQIMEGDLLRTMKEHLHRIGHVHTAGVPGRHELDDRQEVSWRAVAERLHHWDWDGYVGHELLPRGDALEALRASFELFSSR